MSIEPSEASRTLSENTESGRPPLLRYEDLAERLSLSLADDALTEGAVHEGCRAAIAAKTGSVLIRPSDIDLVKNWLAGSDVKLCAVTGFPGGGSTTAARLYEARDVLRRGAVELALTMNLGKLLSRQFLYLESELLQIAEQCHQAGARLRAVFEAERIERDHLLIGIRLAKRTGVDTMELAFRAADPDLMTRILRFTTHHAKGKLSIAVEAPELTAGTAVALHEAGADLLVTPNAIALLDDWRIELKRREEEENKQRDETGDAPAAFLASE